MFQIFYVWFHVGKDGKMQLVGMGWNTIHDHCWMWCIYLFSSLKSSVYLLRPTLLGLCVWKSCEKGVKSLWKKGTTWNQCWQKYKFTTWTFWHACEILSYMWKIFVICVNFFSMHFISCEIFSHMWNKSEQVKFFQGLLNATTMNHSFMKMP